MIQKIFISIKKNCIFKKTMKISEYRKKQMKLNK
jgi:hypothetical protein